VTVSLLSYVRLSNGKWIYPDNDILRDNPDERFAVLIETAGLRIIISIVESFLPICPMHHSPGICFLD